MGVVRVCLPYPGVQGGAYHTLRAWWRGCTGLPRVCEGTQGDAEGVPQPARLAQRAVDPVARRGGRGGGVALLRHELLLKPRALRLEPPPLEHLLLAHARQRRRRVALGHLGAQVRACVRA